MIPFTTINLDKPRKIRFGMAASVEFEELTGINLMKGDTQELSYKLAAQLLWVMLKQDDEALTLKDTLRLVDDNANGMDYVLDTIGQALEVARGEQKNAKPPTAKK